MITTWQGTLDLLLYMMPDMDLLSFKPRLCVFHFFIGSFHSHYILLEVITRFSDFCRCVQVWNLKMNFLVVLGLSCCAIMRVGNTCNEIFSPNHHGNLWLSLLVSHLMRLYDCRCLFLIWWACTTVACFLSYAPVRFVTRFNKACSVAHLLRRPLASSLASSLARFVARFVARCFVARSLRRSLASSLARFVASVK